MKSVALRALLVAGTFVWASIDSVASAQYYYVSCQPRGWHPNYCQPQPQCGYGSYQEYGSHQEMVQSPRPDWQGRMEWADRSEREERVAKRSHSSARKSEVRTEKRVSSSKSSGRTHYASSYSRTRATASEQERQKKVESLTVRSAEPDSQADIVETKVEKHAPAAGTNPPPDLPEPKTY